MDGISVRTVLRKSLVCVAFVSASALGCADGGSSSSSASGGADDGLTASGSQGETQAESGNESNSESGESGQVELVSIEIVPADPVVEVVDGVVGAPVDFTATAHYSDGSDAPLNAGVWSYDRPDVAAIGTGTGTWTPTGEVGGIGTVSVESQGISGTTSATVIYKLTHDPDGVPPATKTGFDGATTPDPSLDILYPYDRTVFARSLKSPVMQWSGGADTDIYHVEISGDFFSFETWQTLPNPSRLVLPEAPIDVWTKLEQAVIAGDIQVSYQRYDGTTFYAPIEHTWTMADASLTGAVYYWAVNEGDVLRLPVGADAPETFLEKPPVAEGTQCIACHSVSSDGSTIVASMYGSSSPWGTWNAEDGAKIFLSGEDYGGVYYPADASGFQAISPEGAYVVTGQVQGGALKLSQSNSTAALAMMENVAGNPVHPVWSPDGSKIAYGLRTDGSWLDFNTSSLWLTNVDTTVPSFSGETQLVPSDPTLPTVTYPTFAPDSEWVAFNKATQARTREGAGELWMVNSNGSVSFPLAEANGVADLTAEQQLMNFEPTFMPVSVGGYYWLIFVSERPYGNTLTDQDPLTRTKQLWVTAISADLGTTDASHPAFWLPGQALDNNNMRGTWALSPCEVTGETCESGFDCCGGFCIDGVCSEDAPCSELGDACEVDEDCCDPEMMCIGGFCAPVIP